MRKILLLALCLFSVVSEAAPSDPLKRDWFKPAELKEVSLYAIQSGGRVKPFDTFAREGMSLLTGKEYFQGKNPVELVLSILFEAQVWQKVEFIQISHIPLKKDLGLDEKKLFFTPDEVEHSVRLMPLFGELDAKQRNQEKLNPYFQALQRLGNQLTFLQDLVSGRAVRLVPPTQEQYNKSDAWMGLDQLNEDMKLRFMLVAATFSNENPLIRSHMDEHVKKFHDLAVAVNPSLYPNRSDLELEFFFSKAHLFRWAWIVALLGIFVLSAAIWSEDKKIYWSGMGLYAVSFTLQIVGFVIRCLIAGRPPVSNMYESILWVGFGAMLFGLVLELIYRKRIIAIGALVFCVLTLVIADNISGILDAGIHPLEPVLRSNLWLTIHVLTITLGYAAFSLSMIIGNIGLGQIVVLGRESEKLRMSNLAFFAYRAVQVGVVLLAAGTILGGVWADYSWGRFWGWDPKETWALIALLGYLALVHARFRGMVSHFGFLAGCVTAFLGVLMAWYGVNFVLGVGLHSYGFSSGGVGVVATYTSIQFLFVLYAAWLWKRNRQQKKVA